MGDTQKPAPPPPPRPRPETFQRQVEILKEIGASPRVMEVAVQAAQQAKK
jgi:hypothetical protein